MLNKNNANGSKIHQVTENDLQTIHIWLVRNKDFILKVGLNNFFESSIYYFNKMNKTLKFKNTLKDNGSVHQSLNNILNELLMDQFIQVKSVVLICTTIVFLTLMLFCVESMSFVEASFLGLLTCAIGHFFVNRSYQQIHYLLLNEVISFRLRLAELEQINQKKT